MMITEGINHEEKKRGTILILTGYDCANVLPHLVQM